jgi:flagellar hook-basal body complex protein FliE
MAINVGEILNAYRSTMKSAEGVEAEGINKVGGAQFGTILDHVLSGTVDTLHNAEKVSLAAVQGKANINEVISAVSSAEVALQTVVTIRDRLVAAYQELMRTGV